MRWHGEIGLNKYASGPIDRDAQHFPQRRSSYASAPENDRRRNLFFADRNYPILDIGNHGVGADFAAGSVSD